MCILEWRTIRLSVGVLWLAACCYGQNASTYKGQVFTSDSNGDPIMEVFTVTEGGMGGTYGYYHDYYAYSYTTGPNSTHSTGQVQTSESAQSNVWASTRTDNSIRIDYLGTYTTTSRGWAYCTFVGPYEPFLDTGYETTTTSVNDWAKAYGIPVINGNVILRTEDYNELVNQGFLPAGVGVAIGVNPELWPIIGVGLTAIAIYYVSKSVAERIRFLNYDSDLLDSCRLELIKCLEKGSSCTSGGAQTCYGFCANQGYWPNHICPLY